MNPPIRTTAACLLQRGTDLFMTLVYDPVNRSVSHRPPGGDIQFGESSSDAVRRHMKNAFDLELTQLNLLGVLENRAEQAGQPAHEILFVFQATAEPAAFYDSPSVVGRKSNGSSVKALWINPYSIDPTTPPIQPAGLLDLLRPRQDQQLT